MLARADFIGCMKWQHAVFLESIWKGKRLDHYSLSRLTEGTPHSSSDLVYVTLSYSLFIWTNYPKSNSLSLLCLLGQIFSQSNSSSFSILDKINLCPTSILQKYSKTIPNSVLPAKSFQSLNYSKSHFPLDLEKFPLF